MCCNHRRKSAGCFVSLEKVNGTTPFVRAYVTQNALGGHSIPISKGAIDVLHAVGVINDSEADKGIVPGLERAVPKNKGVEFGSLLQQLAADLANNTVGQYNWISPNQFNDMHTPLGEPYNPYNPSTGHHDLAPLTGDSAQIRQGARPDVYAAANAQLPDALYAQHLVDRPVPFARNRLVLAVPAGSPAQGLRDLERSGRRLAVGSPAVPVGAYTRQVLARLDADERARLLGNVRSREPDVTGVVGKLTQGAVDGGFVYVTDVRAARGALRAIELPAALEPAVAYEVAVVPGGGHTAGARAFVDGLLHGRGAADLRAAGFEPAPP